LGEVRIADDLSEEVELVARDLVRVTRGLDRRFDVRQKSPILGCDASTRAAIAISILPWRVLMTVLGELV